MTAAELPLAFLAGLLSIITPCVLPLVPGYLSAVSAVEADRLGEPGVGSRVARSSVPFIVGFTTVFVVLGAAAATVGGALDANRRAELAGLALVILGLAFLGLLPWPERLVAPELLVKAHRRGSGLLLGAAFAVCAAPCIGTVLASVLVLAGSAEEVLEGSAILAAYSAGLALAFVLAAVAFVRAMSAFRWLRDHYLVIRIVSGVALVLLGLAFFFHRDGWIRVGFDRALDLVGLGT
jgi:cytochrome c-type biogenesis protein